MPRNKQQSTKKSRPTESPTTVQPTSPTPRTVPMEDEGLAAASSAAVGTTVVSAHDFINVSPPSFAGRSTDDAFAFVKSFERYIEWKNVTTDDRKRTLFAVLLQDSAAAWYDTIGASEKSSYDNLRSAFNRRYLSTDAVQHRSARDLFTKKQADAESVDDFVASVRRHALQIGASDDIVKWILLCGLKPHISAVVTQQKASTVDEIIETARLAELTTTPTPSNDNAVMLEQIAQLQAAVRRLDRDRVENVGPSRAPTPERRHVTFRDDSRRSPTPDRRQYNRAPSSSSSNDHQEQPRVPPNSSSNNWQPTDRNQCTGFSYCNRCARQNCKGQRGMCTAYGKQCFVCHKLNHVARACRAAQGVVSDRPKYQY